MTRQRPHRKYARLQDDLKVNAKPRTAPKTSGPRPEYSPLYAALLPQSTDTRHKAPFWSQDTGKDGRGSKGVQLQMFLKRPKGGWVREDGDASDDA